ISMRPSTMATPSAQMANRSVVVEIAVVAVAAVEGFCSSRLKAGAIERSLRPIGLLAAFAGRSGALAMIPGFQVTGPGIRTIGTSSFGSASDSAGTTSALARPSAHTRWRADADERRRATAARPVEARIADARAAASTNTGSEKAGMAYTPVFRAVSM